MRAPARDVTPTAGRRIDGDQGAVVIEAALILPLLLVLVAGVIDFGVGFRNRLYVQSATRNGARAGASVVNNPAADQIALSSMYAGLTGTVNVEIKKVIIYEANNRTNGEPSQNCRDIVPPLAPPANGSGISTSTDNCNVYGLAQVQAAASVPSTFRGATTTAGGTASTCADGWNRYWCAGGTNTTSNERTASFTGVMDSFGMYVLATYEPFTGLLGDELEIADWVVMRMEPAPG